MLRRGILRRAPHVHNRITRIVLRPQLLVTPVYKSSPRILHSNAQRFLVTGDVVPENARGAKNKSEFNAVAHVGGAALVVRAPGVHAERVVEAVPAG